DIVRTPGTESNVKEIYDACHRLSQDPANVIFNQFSEFGNYVIHRAVTGPALARIFASVNDDGGLTPRAFVAASGSGGALAAGDHLKETLGTQVCVVEAQECPTLLYNGYGEHNIQGIGDKHVPLIHNVMNTDFVIGVSDAASDNLNLLFNTTAGRSFLARRSGLGQETLGSLDDLGLSSIANIIGAVKYAKYMDLGADDAVLTVATDGAEMYRTELSRVESSLIGGRFDELKAAETYGRWLLGASTDHTVELDRLGRERIFNLGYFTWVEQQGVTQADFDARRSQAFWNGLMKLVDVWDGMIDDFNAA
ncbi:MAG: pyridoxal-5'-phosphate-dependent protein subunit beta, partial [Hyphomicrobiaceae bacterium]